MDDTSSSIDPLFTTIIFLAAFATFAHLRKRQRQNNECQNLPPILNTGIFETMKICSGKRWPGFLLNATRSFGSIFRLNLLIPSTPMVVAISDANLARDIFSDPLTTKPKEIYGALDGVTVGKKSMFTSEGKYWHSRRKGLTPAFSSMHIKRMNAVAIEKTEHWIQTKLVPMVELGESFNVGKEMIGITLGAIAETAFEYTISDDEKLMFLHELELSLKEFTAKANTNPFRCLVGLLIPERRRAFVASKRLQALALKILQHYRTQVHPTKGTILDRIVSNDAYANDEERAADIILMLIGGHDSVGYTMAWILKELAKNPEEQQRLRDTLRASNPNKWSQCEYLRKVVKEGMRLHIVPAGGASRRLGRNFEMKEGYLLSKNSIVFTAFYAMMRDEDVYENAESFNPSRWDNPTKAMNGAFIPFAMGKQDCIGQSLANAEIHSIIPRIISEFELFLV